MLARHPHVLIALTFVGVAVVGLCAIPLVGRIGAAGPLLNVLPVLGGAALIAFGVRALRAPTTLVLSANEGTDAHGQQRWGPSRAASEEEGRNVGAVSLVVGSALVAFGVFAGFLS